MSTKKRYITVLQLAICLLIARPAETMAYSDHTAQKAGDYQQQQIKEIDIEDMRNISGVSNTYYKVRPGNVTTRVTISNIKNCTFDFQNHVVFRNEDICIAIKGEINGLTLKNFKTENCKNYQISVEGWSNVQYDRNDPATYINDLQLVNIHSDNAGNHAYLFNAPGGFTTTGPRGVIKGFVMRGCSFKNSPLGSTMCYLGSGENYSIEDNLIENVNTNSTNHNGLFWLCGNGSFIRNKQKNSQGQMARFWLFSHKGKQSVVVHDNIDYNSVEYSAFEIQANNNVLGTNKFLPADALIYNNTAVSLRKNMSSTAIDAQMLDLYSTGGKLYYYNNLGANLYKVNGYPVTDMINFEGGGGIVRNSGNVYKKSWRDVLKNTNSFTSKISGVGANSKKKSLKYRPKESRNL